MTAAGSDERRDTWREDLDRTLDWTRRRRADIAWAHDDDYYMYVEEALVRVAGELDALYESKLALESAMERLERERGEARSHVAGPMPSPERIAQAHSRLPADWFKSGYAAQANHGVGHFTYHQGSEACYICTLLGLWESSEQEVARLRDGLRRISAVRLPTGNEVGRDELRACHKARIEMQTIARSLLSGGQAESTKEQG